MAFTAASMGNLHYIFMFSGQGSQYYYSFEALFMLNRIFKNDMYVLDEAAMRLRANQSSIAAMTRRNGKAIFSTAFFTRIPTFLCNTRHFRERSSIWISNPTSSWEPPNPRKFCETEILIQVQDLHAWLLPQPSAGK